MDRVVAILLALYLFFEEFGFALFGLFGLQLIGLSLGERRLRLLQRRFVGAGINLKERIAFLHHAPFLVIYRYQMASNAGANVGIDRAIQGSNPLSHYRHILR